LDALDRGTKERDHRFSNLPEDPPQAHTIQGARLTDGYRDTRLRLDSHPGLSAGSTVRQTPAALHHDGDENLKDYIAAEEQETDTDE